MSARSNLFSVAFALGLGLLFLAFNNCSDVSFSPESIELSSDGLNSENNVLPPDNGTDPLPPESGTDLGVENPVVDANPVAPTPEEPVVVEIPIEVPPPSDVDLVTEVITQPEIIDSYPCGDTSENKVQICHRASGGWGTVCIAKSALQTHLGHVGEEVYDGEARLVGDYFGQCRR